MHFPLVLPSEDKAVSVYFFQVFFFLRWWGEGIVVVEYVSHAAGNLSKRNWYEMMGIPRTIDSHP